MEGEALRRAGLVPGMKLLDLASGTGVVARAATEVTKEPRSIVGMDASYGMLRSGHTSSAFVTAVTIGETYRRRHDDLSVGLVYAVGLTLASVVAACRILAGKHFLSDVLVGAIVGTAFGLLIPALHDRRGG